ncbi:hypothetical protein [Armatimonas sp.]|uniref:hypothetical protein n=1 Tax=Armatimonas sp. TaxID=1872638 RepID=UPI003752AF4F
MIAAFGGCQGSIGTASGIRTAAANGACEYPDTSNSLWDIFGDSLHSSYSLPTTSFDQNYYFTGLGSVYAYSNGVTNQEGLPVASITIIAWGKSTAGVSIGATSNTSVNTSLSIAGF